MSFASVFMEQETRSEEEIREELEGLEFQLFRMQDNLKEIAKRYQVLGIEQTKDSNWVIIYMVDDGASCKIMLHDCNSPYKGSEDFHIRTKYIKKKNTIHIGDIQGPENKGHGSVCMTYLKEVARERNIQYITGNIAARDWNHVDRLIHFYEKHQFQVELNEEEKNGRIWCSPFM